MANAGGHLAEKFQRTGSISGFSHGTDVWLNNAKDFDHGWQVKLDEDFTRDDIMNHHPTGCAVETGF